MKISSGGVLCLSSLFAAVLAVIAVGQLFHFLTEFLRFLFAQSLKFLHFIGISFPDLINFLAHVLTGIAAAGLGTVCLMVVVRTSEINFK